MPSFASIVEVVVYLFEGLGVSVIVGGFVLALWISYKRRRTSPESVYEVMRASFGRAVLLGLEILVAADIIRTVTVSLTLQSLGVLGALVAIRTFLSWSLEVEIDGRWPWQQRRDARDGRSVL